LREGEDGLESWAPRPEHWRGPVGQVAAAGVELGFILRAPIDGVLSVVVSIYGLMLMRDY
jgi:hypothetical protein